MQPVPIKAFLPASRRAIISSCSTGCKLTSLSTLGLWNVPGARETATAVLAKRTKAVGLLAGMSNLGQSNFLASVV